jgi:Eukaryotic aspartyl protease
MARTLSPFSLLTTLSLVTSVFAIPMSMPDRGSDIPRTIRMPIARKARDLSRRSMIQADLSNGEFNYFIETQIGTPPQTVELKIDTGSSDTWAYTPAACSAVNCQGGSCKSTAFLRRIPKDCSNPHLLRLSAATDRLFLLVDPTQSSTFSEVVPGGFSITYDDGSDKYGDYVSDNLAISGVTIQALEMGLALGGTDSDTFGIMGLGFDALEATSSKYPSIMDDMVSQGLIGSLSYSLWLDDLRKSKCPLFILISSLIWHFPDEKSTEASTGTILFGGYDTTKFSGSLTTLPIVPNGAVYNLLQVDWSSLSLTDQSGTTTYTADGFSETVILDSGTTVSKVPSDVFASLSQYFNLQAQSESDGSTGYYVDCNIASSQGSIDFGFSGVTIQVPFSELALSTGSGSCLFGLQPGDGILGDTFLRSAYVLYDLGNQQISLAQTVF